MPWPVTPGFGTTNVDAGTDSPASARSDIKDLMDDVTDMITARGAVNGIASLDSSGKVPVGQLPTSSSGGLLGYRAWQAAGNNTWTVPAGATRVKATVVGGGGGGSNGTYTNGGGAGGHIVGILAVTPGQVLLVNVGAGGAGGISIPSPVGSPGGDSGVQVPSGDFVVAYGGQGGGSGSTVGVGGGTNHNLGTASAPFTRNGENGTTVGGLTSFSPVPAPSRNGHGGAGGNPGPSAGAAGNAGQSGFIILEW